MKDVFLYYSYQRNLFFRLTKMTKNESVRGSKGNVGNLLNDCPHQSILCNCAANVLQHRERTMDDYSKQKTADVQPQRTNSTAFVCANLAQHSLNSIFYKSVFSTTLSSFSTSLALVLYELLLPLHTACAVFLVSPSDCCFACPATADQYPALCVWRARRHRWNNNRLACLYRTVSQLVPETQETQCKTIIYNNTASRQALRWWSSFM